MGGWWRPEALEEGARIRTGVGIDVAGPVGRIVVTARLRFVEHDARAHVEKVGYRGVLIGDARHLRQIFRDTLIDTDRALRVEDPGQQAHHLLGAGHHDVRGMPVISVGVLLVRDPSVDESDDGIGPEHPEKDAVQEEAAFFSFRIHEGMDVAWIAGDRVRGDDLVDVAKGPAIAWPTSMIYVRGSMGMRNASSGACCWAPNVSVSPTLPWGRIRRIVSLNASAGSKNWKLVMS